METHPNPEANGHDPLSERNPPGRDCAAVPSLPHGDLRNSAEAERPEPPAEPHLILHKVRGEPAFDIAIPITIAGEAAWLIPTSGHRAHPYWNAKLADHGISDPPPPPEGWPDHYHYHNAKPEPRPKAGARTPAPTLADLML